MTTVGVTPSESYLASLCARSFLKLWSYPNLYRNQAWGSQGEGKELCDLLVVFGNDVIIFSDKLCAFPASANVRLDWARWYRRAVRHSADQVAGAERWLKEHSSRIFLDRACTIPLPIELPSADRMVVHRVVVAHGASERCRDEMGGSGSLMVVPSIVDRAHYEPVEQVRPFQVGLVNANAERFIHVVDDFTLDVLLNTLDTIADFVIYLQKKATFVLSGVLGAAAGEEELLAWYLRHFQKGVGHVFEVPGQVNSVALDEGFWNSFKDSPMRLRQVEADRISYSWDRLIDTFAEHALAGTQYFKSEIEIRQMELGLRAMAREPRVRRRQLSKMLFRVMERADQQERSATVLRGSDSNETTYVFLSLAQPTETPEAVYRVVRRNMLEAYCLVARQKAQVTGAIVGIATEPFAAGDTRSEDMMYLDESQWTPELEAEATSLSESLNILQDVRATRTTEYEYPPGPENESPRVPDRGRVKGRNRNEPCACGSGKKAKRCCAAPTGA